MLETFKEQLIRFIQDVYPGEDFDKMYELLEPAWYASAVSVLEKMSNKDFPAVLLWSSEVSAWAKREVNPEMDLTGNHVLQ